MRMQEGLQQEQQAEEVVETEEGGRLGGLAAGNVKRRAGKRILMKKRGPNKLSLHAKGELNDAEERGFDELVCKEEPPDYLGRDKGTGSLLK
eukprot:CAMPEP_0202388888 /NCGR_PEP_ID=MMETSP1127-20130417/79988_1 /ASSEMBLY_ACC=CAM_ASM_000462 /TAXON_ID=3047 /ORGANISM="Dunaliella tertiolecta, Strain CCMP1320" /LENGTH=91 /DNA_ID=CAMNT_0048990469 /DNA_START=77 /DNA_END=353 /DNA_ORIENTATION=-